MRYEAFAPLLVVGSLFVVANQGLKASGLTLQSSWIAPMFGVPDDAPIPMDCAFPGRRPLVDG
jgi:hypothetical protein